MASVEANPESNDDSTLHTSPLLQHNDNTTVVHGSSWVHPEIAGNYQKSNNMESVITSNIDEQTTKSKSLRYIYTIILCYLLFAFGMQTSAQGPAMVDLSHIYDVSMDLTTIIASLWSVGYCIGALSATLFRWINRQLTASALLTVATVAFALLPHCPSVYFAYACMLFVGIGHGVLDTSQNVWLLEMWHENPNPVMQLSQAIYGVGTIVAPLIERPFVTGDDDDDEDDDATNSTDLIGTIMKKTNTSKITPEKRRENLTIPFAIFSAALMLGVIILFLMYFIRRYEAPPKEILEKSRDTSPNANQTKLFERPNAPKILVIALAALCLGAYVSVEISFFNFSATFAQYIPIKVSAPDAAAIQSALAAAFTAGRACNFFIAMKLKPRTLLIIHYSTIILSFIALLFAGQSLVLLWIANVTMGYGFSAMWSSILTFMETYLIVNDTVGGIMVSCAGVFGAFVPYLIGLKIESIPMSLVYIDLAIVLLSCSFHIVIRFIVRSQKAKSS